MRRYLHAALGGLVRRLYGSTGTGLARRVNDGNVKWFTLAAACFGLFMAILDNLVVNIALPTISRDLDASTTQLQWIVSAYTLVFASLQITAGGFGDRLGRKRCFIGGLALFTLTSFAAAFVAQHRDADRAARAAGSRRGTSSCRCRFR